MPSGLELQRLGPGGRHALFTFLTFRHGHFVRNASQHFMHLLGLELGLFFGGFDHLGQRFRADDRVGRREPDVHSMHLGTILFGKSNCVRQGAFGGGRKVSSKKNILQGDSFFSRGDSVHKSPPSKHYIGLAAPVWL